MPRLQDLVQVMSNLVEARHDSNGIVNARDYVFRRHKDKLYLMREIEDAQSYNYPWQAPFAALSIPEAGLTLTLEEATHQGINIPAGAEVVVKSREGGELIKLGEPTFHKAIKKLLQEAAIVPWMRETIPLVYINGRVAAVWGLAVAVDCRLPGTASMNQMQLDTVDDAPKAGTPV